VSCLQDADTGGECFWVGGDKSTMHPWMAESCFWWYFACLQGEVGCFAIPILECLGDLVVFMADYSGSAKIG
jgi:hypothetical protein